MDWLTLYSWLQTNGGALAFVAILMYAPTLILLTRAINRRMKALWPLVAVTDDLTPRDAELLARWGRRQIFGEHGRPGSGILGGEERRIQLGFEEEP